MSESTAAVLLDRDAQCVRCRFLKPNSCFRRNAAGTLTAWCEHCRAEAAKKWGIEEDLVEMAYGLHVYENWLRKEAQNVAAANVATGKESLSMLHHLETNLRQYEMVRLHRLPVRLGSFLRQYRRDFYAAVNMVPPEITLLEDASVESR